MKTHLYRIERRQGANSILSILNRVTALELAQRNRRIDGHDNRIEDIQLCEHNESHCALVNYVKLRMDHGPGRASRASGTTGFDLAQGEGFSEETAALIDLTNNYAIVEYNHHGARASSLCDYLSRVSETATDAFEFLPCLDENADERFERFTKLTRVELRVAPRGLTEADKRSMRSFSQCLDFAETADAPVFSMTLSGVRRRDESLGQGVWDAVRTLIGVIRRDQAEEETPDTVKALKVTGRQTRDLACEMLDLVKGRVFGSHQLTAGVDLRYPSEDRWSALMRDHLTWASVVRRQ